jgi:AraC-like DNA-binding protein
LEGAELAEKLLIEGKSRVEAINYMAGFSNPAYVTTIVLKYKEKFSSVFLSYKLIYFLNFE